MAVFVESQNGERMLFVDELGIPRTPAEMEWSLENNYVIPSFRQGKVTRTKLLKYVDLRLDWYIPSTECFEFLAFIRLAMGKEPENVNSKPQMFFIDALLGQDSIKPYFDVRGMDYSVLANSILILSSREFSKALTLDTKIATPNGYVTIEDVNVGDEVISRTGKPTKVMSKSDIFFDSTYEITLADGRVITTSKDHDNILWKRRNGCKSRPSGMEEIIMKSCDMYENGVLTYRTITDNHRSGEEYKYYIPMMDNPIEYTMVNTPIDPYTVGVFLGDGSVSKGVRLSQTDNAKKFRCGTYTYNKKFGCSYTRITVHNDDLGELIENIPYDCKIQSTNKSNSSTIVLPSELNGKVADFIGTDRSCTKKIPDVLKTGSVHQRTELLKGLMDTDGTINEKGSTSFTTVSKQLAEDVRNLVFSLGGSAIISERKTSSNFGIAYSVMIRINRSIFKLRRKKDREIYVQARSYIGVKSIEKVHTQKTQCITVDCPTKSFVLHNGIVTHNSVLTVFFLIYLAYKGRRKGFGRINFGLYVSDKMGPAGNVTLTMRTIKQLVKKSEYLSARFEYTKFTDEQVVLIRYPTEKRHIDAYNRAMKQGKKLDEVPLRGERTLTIKGIGASGGRGPLMLDSVIYCDNKKTTIGEVKVGDKVAMPNGDFGEVTKKSKIFNDNVYRLTYADGRTVNVNETHINIAWIREKSRKGKSSGKYIKAEIVTNDLIDLFNDGSIDIATKHTEPVRYSHKELPVDPYMLGVILGDGNTEKGKSSTVKVLYDDSIHYYEMLKDSCDDIRIDESHERSGTRIARLTFIGTNKTMKEIGLSGVTSADKFIPEIYLHGSIEQRKALLSGLLDTNGSCCIDSRSNSSEVEFSNISKNLADGVVELSRSLGYRATISYRDRGGNRKRLYRVNISSFENQFTLKRKVDRFTQKVNSFERLVKITYLGKKPTQCITIDHDDHEFLVNGYIPTHNSRDEDLTRPQFAVFDDMVANEEDVQSDVKLAAIESTIEADVGSSLAPKSFKIFIGTAYSEDDPIVSRISTGVALPVVFPRAEKIPTRDMNPADFVSVWIDRFTYENQLAEFEEAKRALDAGNPRPMRTLKQEKYCDISSATDRLIPEQCIQYKSMEYLKETGKYHNWFITTDYTSSDSLDGDLSGQLLFALDWNGQFNIPKFHLKHNTIEGQYQDTLDLVALAHERYKANFVEIGVEIDGGQAVHLYGLKKYAESIDFKYPLYFAKQISIKDKPTADYGIRSKFAGDKLNRFKIFSPAFHNKRLWFNIDDENVQDMEELVDEEIPFVSFTGINCVSGETTIITDKGNKKIMDLSINDNVLSLFDGNIQFNNVNDVMISGVSETYRVETENGFFDATECHMVLTCRGYVKVGKLLMSDRILTKDDSWGCMDTSVQEIKMDATNQQLTSIEKEDGYTDMFMRKRLEKYLEEWKYITKTKTRKIIRLVILYIYLLVSTKACIKMMNIITLLVERKRSKHRCVGWLYLQKKESISELEKKETITTEKESVGDARRSLQCTLKQKNQHHAVLLNADESFIKKTKVKMSELFTRIINVVFVALSLDQVHQIKSAVARSVQRDILLNRLGQKKKQDDAREVGVQKSSRHLRTLKENFTQRNVLAVGKKQKKEYAKSAMNHLCLLQKNQDSALENVESEQRGVKIKRITANKKKEVVYDIEVNNAHNFILFTGEILHNSKHDDGLDMLSQLALIDYEFPPEPVIEYPLKAEVRLPSDILMNMLINGQQERVNSDESQFDPKY